MLINKIKQLCVENGITIARLERELNLGNGTIHKWGKAIPAVNKVEMVADWFNISVDELLGRRISTQSYEARNIATIYDLIPKEKQNLVRCYVEIMQSNNINC